MRYSLHQIDTHDILATTVAADRDEALEWFSEKLRLMLTFEGDPVAAVYLLDEWPEGLLAHAPTPPFSGITGRWALESLGNAVGRCNLHRLIVRMPGAE